MKEVVQTPAKAKGTEKKAAPASSTKKTVEKVKEKEEEGAKAGKVEKEYGYEGHSAVNKSKGS